MSNLGALFAKIQDIALRGERCPFNDDLPPGGLSELARAGRIRIEVFRHNWRVVTITSGPHSGISTMRDPGMKPGAKPYVVIDGTSPAPRNAIPQERRQEPWKPGTPRQ